MVLPNAKVQLRADGRMPLRAPISGPLATGYGSDSWNTRDAEDWGGDTIGAAGFCFENDGSRYSLVAPFPAACFSTDVSTNGDAPFASNASSR